MFVTSLIVASYLIVLLFTLFMTLDEQSRTGSRTILFKTLSFLACVFWPVTFVTAAVAAQRSTS